MNEPVDPREPGSLRLSLNEALARYEFGFILPEGLSQVALDALEAGYDSASLRLLAGTPDGTPPDELHALFGAVLDELDLHVLDPVAAARLVVWSVARHIAAGTPRHRDRLESLASALVDDDRLAHLRLDERLRQLNLARLHALCWWPEECRDVETGLPFRSAKGDVARNVLAEFLRIAGMPEPPLDA